MADVYALLTDMCPHCGRLLKPASLTRKHQYEGSLCPGSHQNPRNPESDRRPLWNGEPNPHAVPRQPAHGEAPR